MVLAIDWAGSEGGERTHRSEATKFSGAPMPQQSRLGQLGIVGTLQRCSAIYGQLNVGGLFLSICTSILSTRRRPTA